MYKTGAIPTLYVGGFLTKEWASAKELRKYGESAKIEKECADICKMTNVPVASISELADGSGIAIKNLTSPSVMLEQANQSGRIDPEDFDEQDIVSLFGIKGL